jgi:hypothetical protein
LATARLFSAFPNHSWALKEGSNLPFAVKSRFDPSLGVLGDFVFAMAGQYPLYIRTEPSGKWLFIGPVLFGKYILTRELKWYIKGIVQLKPD